MTKPSVHLNGTSREALAAGYEMAAIGVINAISALDDAAPNGRDYYPQGDDAFRHAMREHNMRVAKLNDVLAELKEMLESVVGE